MGDMEKIKVAWDRYPKHYVTVPVTKPLEFVGDLAVAEIEPNKFKPATILVVVNKEKKTVLQPSLYTNKILFLADQSVLLERDSCGKTLFHYSNQVGKTGQLLLQNQFTVKDYHILGNGNIVMKDMLTESLETKSAIYDPIQKRIVSGFFDKISSFQTDQETKISYANVKIKVPTAKSGNYAFYGKMDEEGHFVSNLYSTITNSIMDIQKEGFSLDREIAIQKDVIDHQQERILALPIIKKHS